MMLRGLMTVGAAAVVGLSACGREPERAAPPSKPANITVYEAPAQMGGRYVPDREIMVRDWRLHHLRLQAPEDAKDAVKAAERYPVAVVFEQTQGEAKPDGARQKLVVVPVSYRIAADKLDISAASGGVGAIRLVGVPDGDRIKADIVFGTSPAMAVVLNREP